MSEPRRRGPVGLSLLLAAAAAVSAAELPASASGAAPDATVAVTGASAAAPAASPSGGGLLALDTARHVVWVTSPGRHQLLEVDTRTRRVLTVTMLGGRPRSIAVDLGTHRVYVGLADGRLQVLAPNGRRTVALVSLPGPVTAVAVDPGRHRVYATTTSLTAGHVGALTAVDDRSEHRIRSVSAGRDPGSVAVDTARHSVWVLQQDTGRLTEFEGTLIASTRVLDGAAHTAAPALAVDPAGGRLYLLIDTPRPPVLVTLSSAVTGVAEVQRTGGTPVGLAVDPVEHRVLVANRNGTVAVYGRSLLATIHVRGVPQAIAYDPTTRTAYLFDANTPTVRTVAIDP